MGRTKMDLNNVEDKSNSPSLEKDSNNSLDENEDEAIIEIEKDDKKRNLEQALELIEAKDWKSLYSYDELSAGLKREELLVDFQTLPCHLSPTFKVKRMAGFEYSQQRTPSYTDRILYRSADGLQSHVKQFAYEPCVDFITSDHKPIRGAFSVILNDMIEHLTLPRTYRLIFSEIECSDLKSADYDNLSDPYVMFLWDSINLKVSRIGALFGSKWPKTDYKLKTLNPKWGDTEIVLVANDCIVNYEAATYLMVRDKDFMSGDDCLGVLSLSVQELFSMKDGESENELLFYIDKPLEYYGKSQGRLKFKLQVIFDAHLDNM